MIFPIFKGQLQHSDGCRMDVLTNVFIKLNTGKYKERVLRQKKQIIYMWKNKYCKK